MVFEEVNLDQVFKLLDCRDERKDKYDFVRVSKHDLKGGKILF